MTINIKQTAGNGSGIVDSDGNFIHNFDYYEVASTGTNVKPYGITAFDSTSAKNYTLDAPYPGAYKLLVKTTNSTGNIGIYVGSTANGISVGGADSARVVNFNQRNEAILLRGISNTKWLAFLFQGVTLSTT